MTVAEFRIVALYAGERKHNTSEIQRKKPPRVTMVALRYGCHGWSLNTAVLRP
jgi:hypothetical protein